MGFTFPVIRPSYSITTTTIFHSIIITNVISHISTYFHIRFNLCLYIARQSSKARIIKTTTFSIVATISFFSSFNLSFLLKHFFSGFFTTTSISSDVIPESSSRVRAICSFNHFTSLCHFFFNKRCLCFNRFIC